MKAITKFTLSALLSLLMFGLFAQDFSNKGTDFWLGYGYHIRMSYADGNGSEHNAQEMILYFTSDVNATVTVEIPGVGYKMVYAVTANQVTLSDPLPKSGPQDARILGPGFYNTAIHITSDKPIVAYAHCYNKSISGASLLFPTNTLGRDYYDISYTQKSNQDSSNAFFFIIAVEDSTAIEITPSDYNLNGLRPGIPDTIYLNKGQLYSVFGTTNGLLGSDLTGSHIRTLNTNGNGCKKIAVFSGTGKMSIGKNGSGTGDNFIAQAFPASAWGLKYLTAPTGSQPNNFFRICVTDTSTNVKVNGKSVPKNYLQRNFYYELQNSTPLFFPGNDSTPLNTRNGVFNEIVADKPILVAQFCTSEGEDGNPDIGNGIGGDPEIIYLSPVEQTINNITLYSATAFLINQSYINVIIKNAGVSSFTLDGVPQSSAFKTHPIDTAFSYAIFTVESGSHTLNSTVGFNSIAYGFGAEESYGYNAGTNVIDLYQYGTVKNKYAIVDFPATCRNSPFKLAITLPYAPINLKWDFQANTNLTPDTNITISNPIPDSVFVKDNKTLYKYTLPGYFVYAQTGTFTAIISAYNPTPDGCSGLETIDYTVNVYDPPTVDFKVITTGCYTDSVHFMDITDAYGRTAIIWNWSFGDTTSATTQNFDKLYNHPDSFYVHLNAITDIGCIGDTTKLLVLTSVPRSRFVISDSCATKNIVFTDSSSIQVGTLVKWVWDFGDGTIDSLTVNTPQDHSYPNPKPITPSLYTVSNSGCIGPKYQPTIFIRPTPSPNFNLPIVCLPLDSAHFFDSTTIIDNSTNGFKYLWTFGDGSTDSSKNPTHYFNGTGPFQVQLKVTSIYGCDTTVTKTLKTLFIRPSANFNTNSPVCLHDTMYYQDKSDGKAQPIVKWFWDFGDGKKDTVQNPFHIFKNAGTDSSSLYVIDSVGCKSDTITKAVTIFPLPKAKFIIDSSSQFCEKSPILFLDRSTPNADTTILWHWNLGDGTLYDTTNGTSLTHYYNIWKKYSATLWIENSNHCKSDTFTKVLDLNPLPNVSFTYRDICINDVSASFKDASTISYGSTSTFQYNWNLNSNNVTPAPTPASSTIKNPTAQFFTTGTYLITDTVTTPIGCKAWKTDSFHVNGAKVRAGFVVSKKDSICNGDRVFLTDTSKVLDFGNIITVKIIWDEKGHPKDTMIDFNPMLNGVYDTVYPSFTVPPFTSPETITLLAYSGKVCVENVTQTILLNAKPKVSFTALQSQCYDSIPLKITQGHETVGLSGKYYYTGKGIDSLGNFNPANANVGIDTLKYHFVTRAGCTDSATQTIKIWPLPKAKWGESSPICEKNGILFTDSSLTLANTINKWHWNFGDGNIQDYTTNKPFTKTYNTANTYNVTLTVTTDSGCTGSTQKQIIVYNLPKVDFTFPTELCLPNANAAFIDKTTIADTSNVSLFNHLWNFGDNTTGPDQTLVNPVHLYSNLPPTNGFKVKLKVTTNNGCSDSTTKPFYNIFSRPIAKLEILPKKEVCVGDVVSFKDESTIGSGPINQWNWKVGNNSSSVESPSFQMNDSGEIYVRLIVTDVHSCTSDSTSTGNDSLTVDPYPYLNLKTDSGKLLVLEGKSIKLIPINGQKPYWYANQPIFKWEASTNPTFLDDDTKLAPLSTPPTSLDEITYTLTLTGKGGCAVSDNIKLEILHKPQIPNVFSPNSDGINDTWVITYLDNYPGATVQVFDRAGQLIYNKVGYDNGHAWDGTLNGSPLPVATYYYIIQPKNGLGPLSGSVTILR